MKNIFEQIINNKMPSYKIYEDSKFIAILDINPKTTGHFLLIPKKKSINLFDIDDDTLRELILVGRKLALIVCKKLNVEGFSLVINNGSSSHQVVFHTHLHIIPAKQEQKYSFEELNKLLVIDKLN
jgi:histidine triad (HIT) family protein